MEMYVYGDVMKRVFSIITLFFCISLVYSNEQSLNIKVEESQVKICEGNFQFRPEINDCVCLLNDLSFCSYSTQEPDYINCGCKSKDITNKNMCSQSRITRPNEKWDLEACQFRCEEGYIYNQDGLCLSIKEGLSSALSKYKQFCVSEKNLCENQCSDIDCRISCNEEYERCLRYDDTSKSPKSNNSCFPTLFPLFPYSKPPY